MIPLQSTFQYLDSSTPPIDHVEIGIKFPRLLLKPHEGAPSTLDASGNGVANFVQTLAKKKYHASLDLAGLFGADYGATLQEFFLSYRKAQTEFKLGDLTIPLGVNFGHDEAGDSDENAFEGIFFLTVLTPDWTQQENLDRVTERPQLRRKLRLVQPESLFLQPNAAMNDEDTTARSLQTVPSFSTTAFRPGTLVSVNPEKTRLNTLVDAALYMVNKKTYLAFLHHLLPNVSQVDEMILLYVINKIVDLTGKEPLLLQGSETALRKTVRDILINQLDLSMETADATYDYVTKNFARLFDFPIEMDKVELLSLKGVVRFNKPPGIGQITFDDAQFYHLAADYETDEGGTAAKPHTSRYAWNKVEFVDEQMKFRFTDTQVRNQIVGPVTVALTAFDNSEAWSGEFKADDPALQSLDIVVDLRLPGSLVGGATGSTTTQNSDLKLRGMVVSLEKCSKLSGAIIIQARKTPTGPWITVSTAVSDKSGNFSMPYPSGQFAAAQAITSLEAGNTTPITTDPSSKTTSISTDFIYILLQGKPLQGTPDSSKDDCSCKGTTTAGRLPSQEDLIQSDQFTQDVGGTCINLTVPNRTLREFNYTALVRDSDPDVSNYTLTAITDSEFNKTYFLQSNGKIKRRPIDLDNPIEWQDVSEIQANITLYQAVTVATGHILHYKSEFKSDGYSLGDLLYSVPLAPGQKKQIVVIDSSHSLLGSEMQDITQTESVAANLVNDRGIVDQIAGTIGEQMEGNSSATTAGVSAAVGASGSTGMFGANMGVAGGYANANSNASQHSGRSMSQFFHEQLKQSINQNAAGYRRLNASAVTSVQEGQKYNAETDVIANHNHCHSVTMMYFEVLRHFAVYQELTDVEECVFVPLLMTKFSMQNVSRWADVLAQRLLPLHSNTYLKHYNYRTRATQHPLLPAFDAVERINTQYLHVDYPKGTYDSENIREIVGSFGIQTELPRPKSKYDFILSLPIISKTVYHQETDAGDVAKTVAMGILAPWSLFDGPETHSVAEQVQQRKEIFDGFMSLDANFQNVPPAQAIRIHNFLTFSVAGGVANPLKLIDMSPQDSKMWEIYAQCLGFDGPSPIPVLKLMTTYFQDALISEWDQIFQSDIAPKVYKYMIDSLKLDKFNISPNSISKYNGGERYMAVNFRSQSSHPRNVIQQLTISSRSPLVQSLDSTPVTFTLVAMKINYSTDHFHGIIYDGGILGNILDPNGVTVDTPENAEEKRDPRKEDIFLANRLIQHLNCNLEYYNRMLWYSLDTNRRWLLLDGFTIQTYFQDGMPDKPHSLASVLKNNLIAVAGNSLVFPVAPGFRISQSLIVRNNADGVPPAKTPSLLDHYRPDEPQAPYRLSVPNRGVYAEAVMGACDSCEKVQPDTSQDWTKFGVDEPTAIATVQPVVPTITDYRANFKDFAPPMINLQNAPAAPDPGAGLAAATDLLGRSGIFKDITGLDANQANAIKTYLSNNENVKAMAQMSSVLGQQAHNTQNSAKIVDNITTGQAAGTLSKEDASKLMKQHIQQQIGGDAMQADLDKEKPQKPTLADAMVSAVGNAKDVKAVVTDGSGGSQSIDVKGFADGQSTTTPTPPTGVPEGPVIADVPEPPLEVVKQTGDGCWAYTTSVMLMWKLKKSLTALDAVKWAGDKWGDLYSPATDWKGISNTQYDEYLAGLGMAEEPLAAYTTQTYVDLMKKYGPIWLTIDSDARPAKMASHSKVLARISGVMSEAGDELIFTCIDSGSGKKITQKFKDFVANYEQELTDLPPGAKPFTNIKHWPEEVPAPPTSSQIQSVWQSNTPLLQRITEAALLGASVSSPTPVDEVLRGTIWPDDPTALLFIDTTAQAEKNFVFSNDMRYHDQFTLPDDPKNLLGRALKGDLQFLHAFSRSPGQTARDTVDDMLSWLEPMYKLSIGQGVTPNDAIKSTTLGPYFTATSRPTESQSLGFLLRGCASATKYTHLDLTRRAIGVCLHILFSSYAATHVRRTLLNPTDLVDAAAGPTGPFKPGTWGKYGPIESFWSLRDQAWPDPLTYPLFDGEGGSVTAADVGSFGGWNGARDAIEAGKKLLSFFVAKTGWDAGVKTFLTNEALAISSTATPAQAFGT